MERQQKFREAELCAIYFLVEAVGGAPFYISGDGTSVYYWYISSGILPSGLSLNNDGSITGIPNTATNAEFTATLVDLLGTTIDKTFSLTTFVPFKLNILEQVSTNQMSLQLIGETNRNYILEYASQLPGTNWTPISTNQSENGTVIFTNCIGADSQRFYRARQN